MGALRQARSFNLDGSNDQATRSYTPTTGQSLPTLIVMIVVLFIIMAFCFWGAPAVRAFCRRRVCCCCPMDEPNMENEFPENESTTPTIILLPYGRMLVVDRAIFAQLRATHTGIDFMELSANLIRAQRIQTGTTNTRHRDGTTNKGFLPNIASEFLPPAYEDLYGRRKCDLPPSYSEISVVNETPRCTSYSNRGNFRHAKITFKDSSSNSINPTTLTLRTFPSVPSIPNELESKRELLLSIKRKYSSLDKINTEFSVQNLATNRGTSRGSVAGCTSFQNSFESRV